MIGVGLSSTANKVNIYINIAKPYDTLVNTQSKFWNTSGFKIDAGLFSGVSINSESIESLLSGGIAFATPEVKNKSESLIIDQHHEFQLHDDSQENWLKWAPKILINH